MDNALTHTSRCDNTLRPIMITYSRVSPITSGHDTQVIKSPTRKGGSPTGGAKCQGENPTMSIWCFYGLKKTGHFVALINFVDSKRKKSPPALTDGPCWYLFIICLSFCCTPIVMQAHEVKHFNWFRQMWYRKWCGREATHFLIYAPSLTWTSAIPSYYVSLTHCQQARNLSQFLSQWIEIFG